MANSPCINFQPVKGYSLIEVMVSIFILSVGILGMASMQLSAKRIGYDAQQRSIATALAHDIIERIRGNPDAVSAYVINNAGVDNVAEPMPDCKTADCTAMQLAAHDLWEWQQLMTGANEQIDGKAVGGLMNPRACITHNEGFLTVTIVWKGLQSFVNSRHSTCGQGLDLYGALDVNRQLVNFATAVLR